LVVLAGAIGSVAWGAAVDRVGRSRPRAKFPALSLLCIASLVILMLAFGTHRLGLSLSPGLPFALIALGGFLMTCTVGPTAAIVIDVVHPGVRATGCSILALFQNMFGLALGPFIAGLFSDAWGLESALIIMPLFGAIAAVSFVIAAGSYESEKQRANESSPPIGQASAFA